MQINLSSIMVDEQEKALKFYTEILGFTKKADVSMGTYRWLTVTSEGTENIELLLEQMDFPPAKIYQKSLYDAGIPFTTFRTDDINKEYKRLSELGVKFLGEPTNWGVTTTVLFEDTCGNLINLAQPASQMNL